MKDSIKKLEEKLTEVVRVKDYCMTAESELRAQLKTLKSAMVEADKCRPVFYPAIQGWKIVDGKFEGYQLTGTMLENKTGTKKLLKGYTNGKFAHIDMTKFTGRIADQSGKVKRTYVNGVRTDIPV